MTAPRILIIRTSALGDIVHALPVLMALRRWRPEARLAWVVEDVFGELLNRHPDLDQVIPVRLRTWRKRALEAAAWREASSAFKAIQRFSADIVLDLMGSHKAGALAALTFADRRYGLARRDRREPSSSIWMSDTVPARGDHATDRMLSILDALDLPRESADFGGGRLPSTPYEALASLGESFFLIHPKTAWPNKNYPAASWASVARRVRKESGYPVWIAWGPGEHETAREVARLSEGAADALPTMPTLPELVDLSHRATVVLGGDTGPVHLAHALNTPVVCVMGPTDPVRNGPYSHPECAVVHLLPCSFCYRRLDSTKACLLNIHPKEVAGRALAVLKTAG